MFSVFRIETVILFQRRCNGPFIFSMFEVKEDLCKCHLEKIQELISWSKLSFCEVTCNSKNSMGFSHSERGGGGRESVCFSQKTYMTNVWLEENGII